MYLYPVSNHSVSVQTCIFLIYSTPNVLRYRVIEVTFCWRSYISESIRPSMQFAVTGLAPHHVRTHTVARFTVKTLSHLDMIIMRTRIIRKSFVLASNAAVLLPLGSTPNNY